MLMVYSSSCSTMKEDGLPALPEGILFEIFLKLPWKSINRFKCVSNVWLSIISDSNLMQNKFKTSFIQHKPWAIFSNHVIPNQHHPPDMKIPSQLSHTQFLSPFNELSGYDGFSFNFLLKSYRFGVEPRNLHLLASSNGLVLCCILNYPKQSMHYFVCNPITKKSVLLPPPPRKGVGKFLHCLVSETCSSSASTFKVMRTPTSSENNDSRSEVEIYCYDLDEWRTYNVAYLQPRDDHTWGNESKSNAITHNGVMYWLEEGYECRVVVYDLKINSYECDSHHCIVLDLPIEGERHGHRPSRKCLGVSEDYVCYGEILGNTLTTWVLMEDNDSIEKYVWNLRYEIELANFNSRKISVMAFSPMDRDLVVLDCGKQILLFDGTTGKSEFLQRLCVPPSQKCFRSQHGYSPITVKATLTTISKGRK